MSAPDTLFPPNAKTLHVTAYDESFTRLELARAPALAAADLEDWMEDHVVSNWGRDRYGRGNVYTANFGKHQGRDTYVCDICLLKDDTVVGHILCRVTEFASEAAPAEIVSFLTPNEDSAFRALGRRAA